MMSTQKEHIGICVCTYKRPLRIRRLLEELGRQKTEGRFDFSIAVVDNDCEESARNVVISFGRTSQIETSYWMEPTPNIALARNKVVSNAKGDYLAFIDDDELPGEDWLKEMLETCKRYDVTGVLGPVLPHFETEPPVWLKKAGFYDRPRYQTGTAMQWQKSRTGNVLLRRTALEGLAPAFNAEFGEGGEDLDFFRRMNALGHRFIWCDEAPVYETVPPHRWTRSFLVHRALLRGQTTSKQAENRLRNVTKSMIAAPTYALALPFLIMAGHHWFMRYAVRLFDHLGLLLAVFGVNPVRQRRH